MNDNLSILHNLITKAENVRKNISVATDINTLQREWKKELQQQIFSGKTGNGAWISPSYINDPFFQRTPSYRKKGIKNNNGNRGYRYMRFKQRIRRNAAALFSLQEVNKPLDVPDLIISGAFYNSINPTVQGTVMDVSVAGFGLQVASKYPADLLELNKPQVENHKDKIWEDIINYIYS